MVHYEQPVSYLNQYLIKLWEKNNHHWVHIGDSTGTQMSPQGCRKLLKWAQHLTEREIQEGLKLRFVLTPFEHFAGLGVFCLLSSENHLFLYSRLKTCARSFEVDPEPVVARSGECQLSLLRIFLRSTVLSCNRRLPCAWMKTDNKQ